MIHPFTPDKGNFFRKKRGIRGKNTLPGMREEVGLARAGSIATLRANTARSPGVLPPFYPSVKICFFQVAAVLFDRTPPLEELRALFGDCRTTDSIPTANHSPAFGGPGFILTHEGKRIVLEVDVQEEPWPDSLTSNDEGNTVMAAAGLGAYGNGVDAGGLARAVQQARYWPEAAAETGRHTGFVRIRARGPMLTGVREEEGPSLLEALDAVLRAAVRITELPGAAAWFCPAGEVVMSPGMFRETCAEAEAAGYPAITAFSASRVWNEGDWVFIDTAGMDQLDLPDLEFAYPAAECDVHAVVMRLVNCRLYLALHGDVMHSGHTFDGVDGKMWKALRSGKSVLSPEREVIRWFVENMPPFPETLMPKDYIPGPEPEEPTEAEVNEAAMEGIRGLIRQWQGDLPGALPKVNAYLRTRHFLALCSEMLNVSTEPECRKALQGAVFIPAFPVIGNSSNEGVLRACLLLGTFDPREEAILLTALLADRMGALYHCGEKVEDPVDRALQKIVEDDAYVAGKRTLLPVAATEGFEVYAFNCLVYREAGEPENSVILTLHTAPGPGKKPVFQIPFAVMRGENPPSLDLGEGEFRPPLPASARAPGRSPQRRPAKRTSRGKIILIILAAFLGLGLILNIFGASRSKDKKDKPEGEKGLIEKIKEKVEEKKRERESRP